MLTRVGTERARFKCFVEMTKHGATVAEAITYINLMWPIAKEEKEVKSDGRRSKSRSG